MNRSGRRSIGVGDLAIEPEVREALSASAAASARPVAIVLAVASVLATIRWGLSDLPGTHWLAWDAAASTLILGGLVWRFKHDPPVRGDPVLIGLGSLMFLRSLLHAIIIPEPGSLLFFAIVNVVAFLFASSWSRVLLVSALGLACFAIATAWSNAWADGLWYVVVVAWFVSPLLLIARVRWTRLRIHAERTRLQIVENALEARRRESLGLMAGGIAHDFNNLLTVIQGQAQLGEARLGDSQASAAAFEQIQLASTRAADLCRKLLDFASDRPALDCVVDLCAALRASEEFLTRSTPRRIALDLSIPEGPLWIRAEPGQVSQLLMNLILNAAEAIEGSGRVTVRVRSPTTPDGSALLSVSDDGPGIPLEARSRIFEPFFSTKGTGRGLGLASTRRVVERQGGEIEVECPDAGGTCFRLWLPVVSAPESVGSDPASSEPASPNTGLGTGAVLVVDDEPAVLAITATMLGRIGFEADGHSDPLVAASRFADDPGGFDAAVIDAAMPGLTGPELIARMRAIRPDLPVLLVTGYSADAYQTLAGLEEDGPFSVLEKPFRVDDLRSALRSIDLIGREAQVHPSGVDGI